MGERLKWLVLQPQETQTKVTQESGNSIQKIIKIDWPLHVCMALSWFLFDIENTSFLCALLSLVK